MANLKEQEKWEDGVYQIEENDPVLGGENGITNKPAKQLANRTLWLKKFLELLGKKSAPKDLTADSTSTADETGHTHKLPLASVTAKGVVKLNSQTASDSEQDAATPKAVKAAYDLAISKQSPATTLAGYGIGNFKVENFVGNVNTLQTDGIYAVTQASRSQNLPVAGNGCHIQVIAGGDGRWCRQIAYIAYSTDMYERHQTSYHTESWSAWVKIDSLDKIPNGKKSSAVNSESEDTVATSKAAKTAYDKGVEAKSAADTAQHTANDANNNANTRQLKSELVGEVAFFARSTPPSGWLKANGAAVSRTTYAALFAAIGTTFGAGDGRATFNLPDLRGEFLRGLDDGRNIDRDRRLGTAQGDAIKTHTITVPNSGFEGSVQGTWFYAESGNGNNNQRENTITYNGENETRPRNIALLACIKY